jgi:hypothetical protein|tara:strand:+ start:284 stop:496 length:213 start_codon:yes stop_codon:yes gene_type:complete
MVDLVVVAIQPRVPRLREQEMQVEMTQMQVQYQRAILVDHQEVVHMVEVVVPENLVLMDLVRGVEQLRQD